MLCFFKHPADFSTCKRLLYFYRGLLKILGKAKSGETVPATLKFLASSPVVSPRLKSAKVFDLSLYLEAFQLNALW